ARVEPAAGDADAATRETLRLVPDERVCWPRGTRWHRMDAMGIPRSHLSTTRKEVHRMGTAVIQTPPGTAQLGTGFKPRPPPSRRRSPFGPGRREDRIRAGASRPLGRLQDRSVVIHSAALRSDRGATP